MARFRISRTFFLRPCIYMFLWLMITTERVGSRMDVEYIPFAESGNYTNAIFIWALPIYA